MYRVVSLHYHFELWFDNRYIGSFPKTLDGINAMLNYGVRP